MNDFIFCEKVFWYIGCWVKVLLDNFFLSEYFNCLNFSYSFFILVIFIGKKKWSVKLIIFYLEFNNCMIKIRKIVDNISVESKLWLFYKNKNGD